ncbi:MAG: PilZ domain-containing protein [Pseudomonadota bacterium]
MTSSNKRNHERVTPSQSVLVKEDTGEIINYYHVKNISQGGMYLLKKISSKDERTSTFTFLLPNLTDNSVNGTIFETRLDENGIYGTAVKFSDPNTVKSVMSAIKQL